MSNLVRCSCKNAFQDEMYGAGIRVGNPLRSGQLRCTVCGTISGSTNTAPVKEKPVVESAKKETVVETKKKSLKGGKR